MDSGIAVSVLEMYISFVKNTGWMAPQNLATFTTGTKPPELAQCTAPSLFLTEAEYPGLGVCRQPLGEQVTTFYHALKFLAKHRQINFAFHRAKSLTVFGCPEMVPSTTLAPQTLRPLAQSPVHILLNARKYSSAMRNVFGPDKEPMECPIAYISPKEVWNNYCRVGRSRLRA